MSMAEAFIVYHGGQQLVELFELYGDKGIPLERIAENEILYNALTLLEGELMTTDSDIKGMSGLRIEWQGCKETILGFSDGSVIRLDDMRLLKGEWPSEEELSKASKVYASTKRTSEVLSQKDALAKGLKLRNGDYGHATKIFSDLCLAISRSFFDLDDKSHSIKKNHL